MDLSNLRELACKNFYKDITDNLIAKIMQPSLEKIYFEVNSKHVYFNLLYYAFETLQNASHLEITSNDISSDSALSSIKFNALLSTKRKTKFKGCKIGCLNLDIEINGILKFCETFMEIHGTLTLLFCSSRDNPDFITNFRNSKKLWEEEKNIPICCIICKFMDQDPHLSFETHHYEII
uniref:Uncharacterized protein n=1 Tax=Panagrolaimus sp. PS1159 TaxID=55785 RepID=A0AC35F1K8_9BILA